MANLINFNDKFKYIDSKSFFILDSALFQAHFKAYRDVPRMRDINNLAERYQNFINQVVKEVKTANQQKVKLLQIDVKKFNIAPEAHDLTVIARALYREYGIELKQVNQLHFPTVMVFSWNRDNPIFNQSANQFQVFRSQNFLCDYQIKCEEKSFFVHKLVLASVCPFFEKNFKGDFKASAEHVIPLKDVKASSVEAWLDYLYTGNIKLTEETVLDLIEMANYYDLGHLKQKSFNFLCETVNVNNLVAYISYCLSYQEEELKEALIENFIKEISIKNLRAFLDLIQKYQIENLESICFQKIENSFPIGYEYLNETTELLEIADERQVLEIKQICSRKLETKTMVEPNFNLVFKWLTLASQYNLVGVIEHCTSKISSLQYNDFFNQIKQLLQLADEYQLAKIKEICTDLLINDVKRSGNLEKSVVLAQKFNLERLKQACEQVKN